MTRSVGHCRMVGHIEGQSRDQATLFPERLEELIAAAAAVRVVDAFVDTLELAKLGFGKTMPQRTGRPPYAPSDLLKLYVWGYLNQVRSSRMLERECRRNIELLWLLNRLAPDFKTIADFRRDNREAIRRVCRAFVQFCKGQDLFGAELVAVDGSKFAGQNSPKRVWTQGQLEKKAAALDKKIEEYLAKLDAADTQESAAEPSAADIAAMLERLRAEKAEIEQSVLLMQGMAMGQVALTDPDVRLMRGAHGVVVGYNVQVAVDARHGLIAHHAVTQDSTDQNQLAPMALAAKEVLEAERLEAVADAGYGDADQVKACDEAEVTTFVPHPRSVNPHGALFDKSVFAYDAATDSYRCPAGKTLPFRRVGKDEAREYRAARKDCCGCPLKPRCTKSARRTVSRHRHEATLEALAERTRARPELMAKRRCLAEHPFGIIKAMAPRFLCRGLPAVAAEMALSVIAFNLKRAMALLGIPELLRRLHAAPA